MGAGIVESRRSLGLVGCFPDMHDGERVVGRRDADHRQTSGPGSVGPASYKLVRWFRNNDAAPAADGELANQQGK